MWRMAQEKYCFLCTLLIWTVVIGAWNNTIHPSPAHPYFLQSSQSMLKNPHWTLWRRAKSLQPFLGVSGGTNFTNYIPRSKHMSVFANMMGPAQLSSSGTKKTSWLIWRTSVRATWLVWMAHIVVLVTASNNLNYEKTSIGTTRPLLVDHLSTPTIQYLTIGKIRNRSSDTTNSRYTTSRLKLPRRIRR